MDKEALLARLRATFRSEMQDHLTALYQGLLALETGQVGAAKRGTLEASLRAAHSLKGAARAVDYAAVAELAHAMEALLGRIKEEDSLVDPEQTALLFKALDALSDAARRPAAEGGLERLVARPELLVALKAAAGGEAFSVPREDPSTPSAPAPRPEAASSEARAPVELARLDALLNRSAELLVERGRVATGTRRLTELAESLGKWQRCLGPATQRVEAVLSRMDRRDVAVLEASASLSQAARNLTCLARDVEQATQSLARDVARLERVAEPLEYQIRKVRMLPFGGLAPLLERAVRDAAEHTGRRARLELSGADVEADRAVLEGLKDSLVHLVRNAVVHGVEDPDVRAAKGKAPVGVVRVTVELRGPNVEIAVADDGAGVDLVRLEAAARERGLVVPTSRKERLRLVFVSALSTRNQASEVAGRGVGLDVVRDAAESLHGGVDIHSEAGEGTRITILVPLTLTRLRTLTTRAGGEIFCIASSNVLRLLRLDRDAFRRVGGRDVFAWDGGLVPVADLAEQLGFPTEARGFGDAKLDVVVLHGADRQAAIVVDELLLEREVVVQSLGPRLRSVRGIAGATVTDGGRPALLLNVSELVRSIAERDAGDQVRARLHGAARRQVIRVLVVDDSPTTRALVASVLEGAGYRVSTEADGVSALERLRSESFQLVVTDVEMPNMSGFELTAAVRADPELENLPVVLVTGLQGPTDRMRGLEAGANAYLPKESFEQSELLATVAQLV